jgi:hypothetical protein
MPGHCMIFMEAFCLVSSYSAYTATPRLLAAALVINHSIIFALKGDRQEARALLALRGPCEMLCHVLVPMPLYSTVLSPK